MALDDRFGSGSDSEGYPQFRPLSGAKQTWISGRSMSESSHKRPFDADDASALFKR
jgi:hypothetical protein